MEAYTNFSLQDFISLAGRDAEGNYRKIVSISNKDITFELYEGTAGNDYLPNRITTFSNCRFLNIVKMQGEGKSGEFIFNDCEFNEETTLFGKFSSPTGKSIFRKAAVLNISNTDPVTISNIDVTGGITILGNCQHFVLNYANIWAGENEQLLIDVSTESISINETFAAQFKCMPRADLKKLSINGMFSGLLQIYARFKIHFINLEFCKLGLLQVSFQHERLLGKMKIERSSIFMYACDLSEFTSVKLVHSKIRTLRVENALGNDKEVAFDFVACNMLTFHNVRNESNMALTRVKVYGSKRTEPLGRLNLINSNLGKMKFNSCDFRQSRVNFQDSQIIDIFLSQTYFPLKFSSFDKIDHTTSQMAFGQLASAYQKQGDTVTAMEYQSLELNAYYQKLDLFSNKWLSKITLFLNKYSNDFGRNWLLGVAFTVSLAFVFFCLLLISTNKYKFGLPGAWDWELSRAFIRFLNPLRFYELENVFNGTRLEANLKLSSWSFISDLFGRIVLAYGYYQTIQAFRRYGKAR